MTQLLIGLLVLLILALLWRAGRQGRSLQDHARRARAAETAAERLLEGLGYTILDRQVLATFVVEVDGRATEATCRADLWVERDGLQLVAEVKSGALNTDPRHPATRRQLLEYTVAFQADGLLLVDMQARRVLRVTFPDVTVLTSVDGRLHTRTSRA